MSVLNFVIITIDCLFCYNSSLSIAHYVSCVSEPHLYGNHCLQVLTRVSALIWNYFKQSYCLISTWTFVFAVICRGLKVLALNHEKFISFI